MMATTTPSPLYVREYGAFGFQLLGMLPLADSTSAAPADPDLSVIAVVFTNKADAFVFAAAPDLLKALKTILAKAPDVRSWMLAADVAFAEAAIANAEGRS